MCAIFADHFAFVAHTDLEIDSSEIAGLAHSAERLVVENPGTRSLLKKSML